jgi:hypothetical protein
MNNEIQFLLYQLPDEEGRVQVVIKDETIWATQKAMAQLFGVGVPAISKHLAHIFEEGELDKDVAVSKMETTTQHGAIEGKTQTNETAFYSLDAIIAVGYRVSSARATKFRIWATKILNEYIRKGFVLDDERLKQGKAVFGKNRFHYAITGQTAPEIIFTRADHSKEHMGLQTWKNAPDGRVLLSDTKVAKNYLPEKEIRQLGRAVTGYFDYIEDLIERENAFSMEQFAASVNEFLTFRRYALLPDKGKISREEADRKAEEEYRLFNPTQRIDSDFDKELRGLFDAE